MGTIRIEGMKFYAYHGHYDIEQIVGNQFIVDVKIKMNCKDAAENDELKFALNYQSIYELVQKEMKKKSRLLENVAHRILNVIYLEFPNIKKVTVKVSKINPPMGGEINNVSVSIKR
jgi:dihydroneopterin aldolase